MNVREVSIFTGERYRVPQCIQRIDHLSTHGWQLRYGGTKLYSDHSQDGSGAHAALALATRELLKRIAKLPAPSRLRHAPSSKKASSLPAGISGPVVRQRSGSRVRDCSFAVTLPRFGDTPLARSVYIGTENTYTPERYTRALAKAMAIRVRAERLYQRAATQARRADGLLIAQQFKQLLASA